MHNFGKRPRAEKIRLIAAHAAMAVLFVSLVALVLGYLVMFLWNAILPSVVAVKPLTYWHAVGLLLLCRILVGRFHGSRGSHGKKHGCPRARKNDEAGEDCDADETES